MAVRQCSNQLSYSSTSLKEFLYLISEMANMEFHGCENEPNIANFAINIKWGQDLNNFKIISSNTYQKGIAKYPGNEIRVILSIH